MALEEIRRPLIRGQLGCNVLQMKSLKANIIGSLITRPVTACMHGIEEVGCLGFISNPQIFACLSDTVHIEAV